MFIYIWEYIVKENRISEFINLYGNNGEWVKLFQKDKNYIKTELISDIKNSAKFITIDFWKTKADKDNFRIKFQKDFLRIDKLGDQLTEHENLIGEFESVLMEKERQSI